MLDDLKNWLRERFEREEYFEYMTGQDPSSPAWLIMMAVGGALYALNLIFPRWQKRLRRCWLCLIWFIWRLSGQRQNIALMIGINFSFTTLLRFQAASGD